MTVPTAAMVVEASLRIRPLARHTPVMTSRSVDERAGKKVSFKCENLQRGGSFKVRGASNMIFALLPEQVAKGVVAFSSGNHAQGVALAAKHVGAQATIVMPADAPRSKMEPTQALGARVVTYDRMREDREEIARKLLEGTGATLVPPFDHAMIVAGQGTVALELLEDVPHLDAIVTCLGGGGLTAGCALIAKEMNPAIRIFAAEPELGNDQYLSRKAGKPITIAPPATIADGLRTTTPGNVTFPIIQELVEDIVLVTDDELREAMRFLLMRMKILAEPSGAAAAAAVLFGKLPPEIKTVGVIISGGNVDLQFQI